MFCRKSLYSRRFTTCFSRSYDITSVPYVEPSTSYFFWKNALATELRPVIVSRWRRETNFDGTYDLESSTNKLLFRTTRRSSVPVKFNV